MNKKKMVLSIFILTLCAFMFSGCCIKHEWEEATCEEPETCSKCGKTRGEALGHEWKDADCEHPKTCKVCGETKGKAKGHDWIEATCTEPKTCSVCGKTEGEPLGHDWIAATLDHPKKCSLCGLEEGAPVTAKTEDVNSNKEWDTIRYGRETKVYVKHTNNSIKFEMLDFDENIIYEEDYALNTYGSWSYMTAVNDKVALITTRSKEYAGTCTIRFFDWNGKELFTTEVGEPVGTYYAFSDCADDNIIMMHYADNDKALYYFNTDTFEVIDADKESYKLAGEDIDFDKTKWSYCNKEDAVNGYFVGSKNEDQWGYLDSDMNEIALYRDASAYNCYGYALATLDGKNYDIIDSDQNVVAKDYVQGTAAYVNNKGAAIMVQTDNGLKAVIVKPGE